MQIEFNTHPIWLIAAGVLVTALVFAYYFRPASDLISPALRKFLAVLRWVVLMLITAYLFEPVLRYEQFSRENPVFVILEDRSTSMAEALDSTTYQAEIQPFITEVSEALGDRYTVVHHHFDGAFHYDESTIFQGTQHSTNLSSAIKGWRTAHSGQKLAGVLLLSDGIYNAGSDPTYAIQSTDPPIHSWVLGDTSQYRDASVAQLTANEEAFAGQPFPIRARVQSRGMELRQAKLQLLEGDRVLEETTVDMESDAVEEYMFTVTSDSLGLHRYQVVLNSGVEERNQWNNRSAVSIRVHDDQQTIAIRYGALHPDIAVFRKALESTGRFKVHVESLDEAPEVPGQEDLTVVFHPVGSDQERKVRAYWKAPIPLWLITGELQNTGMLNRIQDAVVFQADASNSLDWVTPRFSPSFSRFQLPEDVQQWMKADLPPVRVPFGQVKVAPQASVWMNQNVGSVESSRPLFAFTMGADGFKRAVLVGSGFWQWRMWNYRDQGNAEYFETWLFRAAQYLLTTAPDAPFEVKIPERIDFNTPIKGYAFYRDATGNPIRDAQVQITLKDSLGRDYPFDFTPDSDRYSLQLGQLPPGNYSYRAVARYKTDSVSVRGGFQISINPLELRDTRARFSVLQGLALQTGGTAFFADERSSWLSNLLKEPIIPATLVSEVRFDDLIHIQWLLGLLIAILALEWFLRKYYGAY